MSTLQELMKQVSPQVNFAAGEPKGLSLCGSEQSPSMDHKQVKNRDLIQSHKIKPISPSFSYSIITAIFSIQNSLSLSHLTMTKPFDHAQHCRSATSYPSYSP